MSSLLKTTGLLGSIAVLIALVITFIKTLTAFLGFLTFAIQAIIVLAFIAVFVTVAVLIFRAWQQKRDRKD